MIARSLHNTMAALQEQSAKDEAGKHRQRDSDNTGNDKGVVEHKLTNPGGTGIVHLNGGQQCGVGGQHKQCRYRRKGSNRGERGDAQQQGGRHQCLGGRRL